MWKPFRGQQDISTQPEVAPDNTNGNPVRPQSHRPLFMLLAVIIVAALGGGAIFLAARKPTTRPPVMPPTQGPVPPQAPVQPQAPIQPRTPPQPTSGGRDESIGTGISFQENSRTFREFGRQYDDVALVFFRAGYASVGGTLTYLASQGNQTFIVHRGREIGRELTGHGGIFGPFDVGGKPAFGVLSGGDGIAALAGVGSYIFVDGQKFGQQYAAIKDATSVNGQLAFIGVYADPSRPSRERSVVSYDGREYGNQYAEVSEPFSMNGKLAFFASGWSDGPASPYGSVIVVTDGAESILPEGQYEAGEVRDENGQIIYLSRAGSTAKDEAIVNGKRVYVSLQSSLDDPFGRGYVYINDQRSGGEYEDVFEVELVNGKLALLVQKSGKGVIIYDGQEYGHHYDYLYDLPGYSTEPFSLARPNTFTAINYLGDVGGKLTYVVTIENTTDNPMKKQIIVKEE